jgi:flagellar P-ring protein FlgI
MRAFAFMVLGLLGCASALTAQTSSARVKDLVMFGGARDNQLVGYGLVAGLANEGDKNPTYTVQAIANMLQRFNITIPAATLSSKNVAAVLVTADIPPFVKPGARLDVTVSAMGDAKTLQGGVLLQTPLLGANGLVYAVAQGALSVGGFVAGQGGAGGATISKNHPTAAQIIDGAIVEKEIPATVVRDNSIELLLREPDFTSSARLATALNSQFPGCAEALDAMTVKVDLPAGFKGSYVDFIARLEAVELTPDVAARIIINERTGTIVANSHIRISSCAVAHGNLTISIASSLDVSQPNPLSQSGRTVVTPRTDTKAAETKSNIVALPELPTLERIASSLNALGVTPRDMMSIFQAMKQAGALQAELVLK